MSTEALLFYAFAVVSLVSALAMVGFVRNIVAGAMSLVVTMISLAGIYVLLGAHLVAAIQVMVYAGAILVLFLFVIMLLNLRSDEFGVLRPGRALQKTFGAVAALLVFFALARFMSRAGLGSFPASDRLPEDFGGFRSLGVQLFTDYVVPVEIASLVLLAAIVGAVILAKRRID